MLSGLKILGASAVVISIILGIFYWYHLSTQSKIEELIDDKATLESNNKILENAVKSNENAIDSLQNDIILMRVESERVNKEFQEARNQNIELQERLENNNLGSIAVEKTELVEKLINNASKQTGRCFELLSGAALTPNELNATSGRNFNSECPWLWPGNN